MSALERWLRERADEREAAGLTRRLRPRTEGSVIDLAGNDYLGLSCHPRVTAAAGAAASRWGAGARASRLVTGTLPVHQELERDLATFTGGSSALVLSTGYVANLAAVTALADADTLIVSDAHVHASLVDACRLARGSVAVVPHLDPAAVRDALAGRTQPRALVLVESIFSVLGDAAPLGELHRLCCEHDATLLVDEAHSLGVAGAGGRGLVHHLRATAPEPERLVVTLTLSKALGSQGGAVVATPAVIEHLVNTARPFIYDTGLAPAAAAAANEALRVLDERPQLPALARAHCAALAAAVGVATPAAAVLSVPMPTARAAVAATTRLAEQGVRVGCFRPPSVPDGISRLRLTTSADLAPGTVQEIGALIRSVLDG
jgi:8-amino-7-oxononanoate synthase